MVHYGHFNALRQAKKLGDELVVGVHSDGKSRDLAIYLLHAVPIEPTVCFFSLYNGVIAIEIMRLLFFLFYQDQTCYFFPTMIAIQ